MTPQNFFEAFVEGNLADCQEAPGSIRRAFNAAIAASHLADHWHAYNKRHNPDLVAEFKEMKDYVEHLSQVTSGAFRDVRSVANVYKHLYTDSTSKYGAHATLDSTGSIESVDRLGGSEFEMVSEQYRDASSRVVFTRRDGSTLEFLSVLEEVVEYWRRTVHGGA